ncbi:MAG: DUF1801 domain-containing protein [Planctomycetota bacterium]|jgi:hypothetical protein
MPTKPTTVTQYLNTLPKDRRDTLKAVRRVILDNLDDGYAESLQYGAISYHVPHSVYPPGYHCDPSQPLPFVGLASQKNYMTISLFCVYSSEAEQRRFREEWVKTGKKLDMGKSCVRFKKIEDVALDVIGESIKRTSAKKFIAHYEASLAQTKAGRTAKKKAAAQTKKKVAKRATKKPTSRRRPR